MNNLSPSIGSLVQVSQLCEKRTMVTESENSVIGSVQQAAQTGLKTSGIHFLNDGNNSCVHMCVIKFQTLIYQVGKRKFLRNWRNKIKFWRSVHHIHNIQSSCNILESETEFPGIAFPHCTCTYKSEVSLRALINY